MIFCEIFLGKFYLETWAMNEPKSLGFCLCLRKLRLFLAKGHRQTSSEAGTAGTFVIRWVAPWVIKCSSFTIVAWSTTSLPRRTVCIPLYNNISAVAVPVDNSTSVGTVSTRNYHTYWIILQTQNIFIGEGSRSNPITELRLVSSEEPLSKDWRFAYRRIRGDKWDRKSPRCNRFCHSIILHGVL